MKIHRSNYLVLDQFYHLFQTSKGRIQKASLYAPYYVQTLLGISSASVIFCLRAHALHFMVLGRRLSGRVAVLRHIKSLELLK